MRSTVLAFSSHSFPWLAQFNAITMHMVDISVVSQALNLHSNLICCLLLRPCQSLHFRCCKVYCCWAMHDQQPSHHHCIMMAAVKRSIWIGMIIQQGASLSESRFADEFTRRKQVKSCWSPAELPRMLSLQPMTRSRRGSLRTTLSTKH